MDIEIRVFKDSDADTVFKIIRNCYVNLEIGGHNQSGINLQIEGNKPGKLIERSKTIKYLIALVNNQIVGVGGYDNSKIHTPFVSPAMQGYGIGKKILDEIISRAHNEGINSLTTWSTIYAQRFYEKNGFLVIGDIFLPEGAKDIHLIEMKKFL